MADTERLESLLDSLSESLRQMLPSESLEEFRTTFRRPGWTTPAEVAFFEGSLIAMTQLATTLGDLQRSTLDAAQVVKTAD